VKRCDSLVIVLGARAKGDAGGCEVRSTNASENSAEVEKHFARSRWARTRAVAAAHHRHDRIGTEGAVYHTTVSPQIFECPPTGKSQD
jgi:hypothetical protein